MSVVRGPALLPADLQHYVGKAGSEGELFDWLLKHPPDLLRFFESMCDDETWCEEHAEFVRRILGWLTDRFFQNKLLLVFAQRAARAIQKHILVLDSLLPKNIAFEVEGKRYLENSLLFGAASLFFQEIILREFRDRQKEFYPLEVGVEVFLDIVEYVRTDDVIDLWKKKPGEIEAVLRQARLWGLPGLVLFSEKILGRYIERETVFELLLKAHVEGWWELRRACYEFINGLGLGVQFVEGPGLFLKFLEFHERSLDVFEKVRGEVTHLGIGGVLTTSPEFVRVVNSAPKLQGLDISSSVSSEYLRDIPENLQELDLSMCTWLTYDSLKTITEVCPDLNLLRLCSNVQLNFSAWGVLQRLNRLVSLDVSRCEQIGDEDFKIIMKSCSRLTDFACEECRRIGDKGFYELAVGVPNLLNVKLAGTTISNALLIEIASRCRNLRSIDITRCKLITDKGVVETVKHCPSLKEFNVSQCNVHEKAVKEIKSIRPYLNLIY